MGFKKLSAMFLACMMAITTAAATAAAAEVPSPTAAADPYSGVGCYMAFFQVQTTTWVYRNNFDSDETGYGSDIFKTVYNNETDAPTSTVINDAVIDGDGEYTITLNDISLEGSTDFYMVAISTNIPADSGILITAAALKYDTREITSAFVQKNDDKKYVHIMLINQWDNAMKDTVNTLVPQDGSDMSIIFTVSGFGYEKAAAEPTAVPEKASVTPIAEAASDNTSAETVNTDAAEQSTDTGSMSMGIIIGSVTGIIAAAVIIIVIIVSVRKKKKS